MLRCIFVLAACTAWLAGACGQEPGGVPQPGPEHKNLMGLVGRWELTVEGVDKKGAAEIKSILGGLFITEDVKISFGDFDMNWHGVIGYDGGKKQYTGVWFDNMNSITQSTSGEADEKGRVITFRGEQPGHGKFIWRITRDGEKNMTIEMMQVSGDEKETPVMKVRGVKQE